MVVFYLSSQTMVSSNLSVKEVMVPRKPEAENIRAILRTSPASGERTLMPWEQEGEFEIEALIVSQRNGELLVRVRRGEKEEYLMIMGFLPGKVTNQRWKLCCVRESGQIELLDGEPLKSQ